MKEKDKIKHIKADILQRADMIYGTGKELTEMFFSSCTELILTLC